MASRNEMTQTHSADNTAQFVRLKIIQIIGI
jgi:hypothetical protein